MVLLTLSRPETKQNCIKVFLIYITITSQQFYNACAVTYIHKSNTLLTCKQTILINEHIYVTVFL